MCGHSTFALGYVSIETAGDHVDDHEHVLGRRPGVLGSRPPARRQVLTNDQPGTAVLDLLDEVPQDERRDAWITATEDRVTVVQKDFEQWGEGRFDVRDVGDVELRRTGCQKTVKEVRDLTLGLLESRVLLSQGVHVLTVRPRMLTFLPH